MGEVIGKCYYCNQNVIHEKPNDYGAFTKKWDKKTGRYKLSDFWHMDCYYNTMKKYDSIMTGHKPKEQYQQLSLFD